MNRYEGMFIFPEDYREEQLDAAVERARGEIEKAGGAIEATTRLGRRSFARQLNRKTAGHFVVMTFRLDGQKIAGLRERYRLSDEIVRVQIIRVDEDVQPAAETPAHGLAE